MVLFSQRLDRGAGIEAYSVLLLDTHTHTNRYNSYYMGSGNELSGGKYDFVLKAIEVVSTRELRKGKPGFTGEVKLSDAQKADLVGSMESAEKALAERKTKSAREVFGRVDKADRARKPRGPRKGA